MMKYLFRWNEIPGKDKDLLDFLKQIFAVDWIKTAKPEKIDERTIKISSEKNFILLKLNNEKTNVDIKIDDGRCIKTIAKMENDKLNIYDSIDWELLLKNIYGKQGKECRCTPILGSEVCDSFLPSRAKIAQKWAEQYNYPFESSDDLARVTLFLSITRGGMFPRNELKDIIDDKLINIEPKHFKSTDEIHGVLAHLPFPIYITTNYDDLMERALKAPTNSKEPKTEICKWNKLVEDIPSVFDKHQIFKPSVANPVVFHLHGYIDVPESMILTRDDYLDFLIAASKDDSTLIPASIQRVFTSTALLFLGYRVEDIDFQILLRLLNRSIKDGTSPNKYVNISVQLAPGKENCSEIQKTDAQKYLSKYFETSNNIYIYWGNCHDFANELKIRCESYTKNTMGGP